MAGALVLFDIDGTLLRKAGPHHRQALEDAVWHVLGVRTSTQPIPVQGMLDGVILREMLKQAGIRGNAAAAALPAIMRKAQALYVRRCPDLRAKVCPGVRRLLARLARRNLTVGLVTGNLSRIGWRKMDRAGLKHHFHFGMFAESGPTRSSLARQAIATARRNGWIDRRSPITLIGDHPNDVAAARANRIRSVAVATGLSPLDELAVCSPNILVPDLSSLDPALLWS